MQEGNPIKFQPYTPLAKNSTIEALQCQNCGGTLNSSYKCEYCGTQYERKVERGVMHYIQTCPAQIQTLSSQVEIDEDLLCNIPQDRVAEYAIREMINALAEALVPYVKLETEKGISFKRTQIIRGTVRVVEPDFRF